MICPNHAPYSDPQLGVVEVPRRPRMTAREWLCRACWARWTTWRHVLGKVAVKALPFRMSVPASVFGKAAARPTRLPGWEYWIQIRATPQAGKAGSDG